MHLSYEYTTIESQYDEQSRTLKGDIEQLRERVDNLFDWVIAMASVMIIVFPVIGIMAGLALWKLR